MFSLVQKWRKANAKAWRDWQRQHDAARVNELREIMRRTATGREMIEFAEQENVRIFFSGKVEDCAIYRPSSHILMSQRLPRKLQPIVLGHEIRHAWQERQGLLLYKATNIADAIVHTRFAEADAYALEAELAWELEQGGIIKGAWAYYKKQETKLSTAFERAAANPAAVKTGAARRAAFDAWFRTSHKDAYDSFTIDDCASQCENIRNGKPAHIMVDPPRPQGAPLKLSKEYLREYGQIAGGNYLADADTHSDLYTGGLSKENKEEIGRLAKHYGCVETTGTAVNYGFPS